jgi:hypothetical protein
MLVTGVNMSWNRQKSSLETMMVAVLKDKEALSLQEIVNEITKGNPEAFTGQSPRNSLYSIIYRRDKNRIGQGTQPLFLTEKVRREVIYSLNPKYKENQ